MERTKKSRFLLLMVLIIATLFVGSGCEAEQNARMSQKMLRLTDLQKYQEGYIQGALLQGMDTIITIGMLDGSIPYEEYQKVYEEGVKFFDNFTEENFIEYSEMLQSLSQFPIALPFSFKDIKSVNGFKDGVTIMRSVTFIEIQYQNGIVSDEEMDNFMDIVSDITEYPTPEKAKECLNKINDFLDRTF